MPPLTDRMLFMLCVSPVRRADAIDPTGGLSAALPGSESAPANTAAADPLPNSPAQQQQQPEPRAAYSASQPLPSSAVEAVEWAASPGAAVDEGGIDGNESEADYSGLFARINLALGNEELPSFSTTSSPLSTQQPQQPAAKRARPSPQPVRAPQQRRQPQPPAPGVVAQLHRLHIDEMDEVSELSVSVQQSDVVDALRVRPDQRVVDDADEEMDELRRCGLIG